jgi:beta-xylosidase
MFRQRALVVALYLALWMIGGHAFGQQVHGDSKNTWLKDKHDPCIIKHDGMYYMFASGEGCPMATSPDLVVWQDRGTAFKTFPKWASAVTQGRDTRIWAPDICYFGGRYRLYYSVSQVGMNRSAIGFASNECLDPSNDKYQWIDHGTPIIESFPTRDTFNAIDPNVVLDEHNQPFLSFGSYWGGIMMCRLDPATGCPANKNAFTVLASRVLQDHLTGRTIRDRVLPAREIEGQSYVFIAEEHSVLLFLELYLRHSDMRGDCCCKDSDL